MRKVAILGVGKLGESIAEGLLASGEIGVLYLVERSEERRRDAARRFRATVTMDPIMACKFAEVIIIATKPNDVLDLCRSIATALTPDHTVISVAAGVRLERVREALGGHSQTARAMPNLAIAIRKSVTGVYAEDKEAKEEAEELFGFVGKYISCQNELEIDKITALGASSPGWIAEFLDGLIVAGEQEGLADSRAIILQAAFGVLTMLQGGKESLKDFVAKVRTPGGTTAAGINEFDRGNLRTILHEGVKASISRATELDSEVK